MKESQRESVRFEGYLFAVSRYKQELKICGAVIHSQLNIGWHRKVDVLVLKREKSLLVETTGKTFSFGTESMYQYSSNQNLMKSHLQSPILQVTKSSIIIYRRIHWVSGLKPKNFLVHSRRGWRFILNIESDRSQVHHNGMEYSDSVFHVFCTSYYKHSTTSFASGPLGNVLR